MSTASLLVSYVPSKLRAWPRSLQHIPVHKIFQNAPKKKEKIGKGGKSDNFTKRDGPHFETFDASNSASNNYMLPNRLNFQDRKEETE